MRRAIIAVNVGELIRPAQGKAAVLITVLVDTGIRILLIICILKITIRVCSDPIVNNTYRGHFTAAIDALLHHASADVHIGVLTHTACPLHGRETEGGDVIVRSGFCTFIVNCYCDIGLGSFAVVAAAVASAIDVAPDGGVAISGNGRLVAS